MVMSRTATAGLVALAGLAGAAQAGTFGELYNGGNGPVYGGMGPSYAAGPYAGAPSYCPPNCLSPNAAAGGWNAYPGGMPGAPAQALRSGPEGVPPMNPNGSVEAPYVPPIYANPRAHLPLGAYADGPNAPVMLWSYGQMNATTDPYDAWGLSTPQMHIPWSTPMAGWTNAATWNWWRERSGALPRNW